MTPFSGYEGIPNKLPEEAIDPKYFDNDNVISATAFQKSRLAKKPPAMTTAKPAAKKKPTKPSQTSEFIKQMRSRQRD